MNQEHLILPIARDTRAIIVFTQEPTQQAIDKLIQFLELHKDTYPIEGIISNDTPTDEKES